MSKHSFKKIDQKEYLKKYLSGDKVKKKKKDKKRKKFKKCTVNIVDDDINHVDCGIKIDEELLLVGEDAPQIVGEYIDEQPQDNKKSANKWKSIIVKEEPNDNDDIKTEDLWGHKAVEFNIKKERRSITPDKFTQNENYHTNKSEKRADKLSESHTHQREHRRSSSSDQSPPRKRGANGNQRYSGQSLKSRENPSTSRHHRQTSSDQSPPRKHQRELSNDQSPLRQKYRSNNGRQNLHLQRHHRSSSDQSPPRKLSNKSNEKSKSIKSTKHQRELSNDQSPPRQRRRSSNDQSPQRKQVNRFNERNQELKSRHHRRSSSSDQSPRRKQKDKSRDKNQDLRTQRNHYARSYDQSPSRKSTRDDLRNVSPAQHERKNKNHRFSSEKDCNRIFNRSPQKEKRDKSFVTSPPITTNRKSPSPPPTHKPKISRTLDGKKAGLQNAAALHEETAERRLKEQHFFEQMPSELSGRNAEVQVRSTGRLGRKARQAREETSAERKLREAKEQETKLKYERWGKGLKQIEDYRQRKADEEYESSKPLARYANDEDLDKYLREKEYAEDPMLEYMRQKRKEKKSQSNESKKPIYEGPYPENRFGIRPGYRWDGVDRSNGYEKKWLTMQNERQAKQEEAYKYSVEDM